MHKRCSQLIITVLISISLFLGELQTVKAGIIEDAAQTISVIAEAVMEGFESSVISQMAGRSGASTPSGAKGIAFEIMYKDTNNLKNFLCFFKPNKAIKLSNSSTDPIADLIVTDSKNSGVGLIQCKDGTSTSQIRKIFKQITSGKYGKAQVVGTKECAEAFNKYAEKNGISATMVNSGISTKKTIKIADKALGGSIKQLTRAAALSAVAGGAFSGAIAAIDSVMAGDSAPDFVANTSVEAFKGMLATGGATTAGYLVTVGLATFSAPTAVSIVGSFAATIIAGEAILAGLDKITTDLNLIEAIAQGYDDFMMGTGAFIVSTGEVIDRTTTDIATGIEIIFNDAGLFWGGLIDDGITGIESAFPE